MRTSNVFTWQLMLVGACLTLIGTDAVSAQTPSTTSPLGISLSGAYQGYDVDTVNMANGNVIVKIPLYSLPETGKLALSFSAIANNTLWQEVQNCEGVLCEEFFINPQANAIPPTFTPGNFQYGGPYASPVGPVIVNDQIPILAGPYQSIVAPPSNCGGQCYSNDYFQFVMYDPDGSAHNLYYDATNNTRLRTTDGSGFLVSSPDSSPIFGRSASGDITSAIVTAPNGVTTEWTENGLIQKDPSTSPQNQITYSNGVYTDTVSSRGPIQQPPTGPTTTATTYATSSGTLTCPQGASGSAPWTVPGPNGAQETFLICYSSSNIHTDFWGQKGQSVQVNGDLNDFNLDETVQSVLAIQAIVLPNGDYWGFTYESADTSASPSDSPPYISYGRLTGIHFPQGGTITYTYDPSALTDTGEYYGPWQCYGGNIGLLTRTVTDINGHSNTWHYNIPSGTVTDPAGNDTVYTYDQSIYPCTPFQHSKTTYSGSATATPPFPLTSTTYSYSSTRAPDLNSSLANVQVNTTTTTLNGGVTSTTGTSYDTGYFTADTPSCSSYNPPGHACDQFEAGTSFALSLGFPISSSVADYSGTLLKTVQTRYKWQDEWQSNGPHVAANEMSLPAQVTTYDGSGQVAQTTYSYDDPNLACSGATGNLTTVSQWNSSGSPVQTQTNWFCFGRPSSTTDSNGNATSITYEPSGLFASTVTQPTTYGVQHVDQYTWDDNTGNMLTHVDQNNVTTKNSYNDSLGRLTLVQNAYGMSSESDVSYSYPSLHEIDIASDLNATRDGILKSQLNYDGLGHAIFSKGPNGAVIRSAFDYLGQRCAVTNPSYADPGVLSCSSSQNPVLNSPDGITYYGHDALGRTVSLLHPDGSSQTWNFSNNNVAIFTDEAGNQWQRTSDALGRLTKVTEPNNAKTYYTYDANGNLTCAAQDGGSGGTFTGCAAAPASWRPRSFNYDSLSRLTGSTNPETGPVTYSYLSNGALCSGDPTLPCSKTDARWTTSYTYDALNRLLDTTYSDGTPTRHLFYDEPSTWAGAVTNGIGRLTQEWTDNDMRYNGTGTPPACVVRGEPNYNPANGNPTYCLGTDEVYSYDAMGRPTLITTTFASLAEAYGFHTTHVGYDLAGNLTSLTYPDGRVVTWGFDAANHLNTVTFDNWSGQHVGYNYLSSASYWPDGSVHTMTFGNGATQTINKNNRLQPSEIFAQINVAGLTQNIFDKQYAYTSNCQSANNGNISYIVDPLNNARSQGFCYDNLNRLSSFSNGDASMQQTYSYDSFGNLSQSGTFSSSLGFDQNNQINSGGYGYDAAGNINRVNVAGLFTTTYSYDAANRIYQMNPVTGANPTAFYSYDANGNRARKDQNDGSYTEYQYLNGQVLAERRSDGTWTDHIYANGQRIASADNGDVRLHFSGTNCFNCGYVWSAYPFALPPYVVQAGDKIAWRQYQDGPAVPRGGLRVNFTDGSQTNWNATDQNGAQGNDLPTQNQWVSRVMDLSAYAGKTMNTGAIQADINTGGGNWEEWFADIALFRADGTVLPVYHRQRSTSYPLYTYGGVSNSAFEVNVTTDIGGEPPANVTTYYLGDHLGSNRVLLSGNGWPVSGSTFYPFGQEQSATSDPNNYKFTGKERDAESGLDYFGARYYASSIGRWMSPDYQDLDEDGIPDAAPNAVLTNPQTLNLYGYVENNPLSKRDFDGHASWQDCNNGTQQCWQGDYNGEKDCGGNAGCLYWNSQSGQWQGTDPTAPPDNGELSDAVGWAFTGLTRMMLAHSGADFAHGAKQMGYGYMQWSTRFLFGGSVPVRPPGTGLGRPAIVPAGWIEKPSRKGGGTVYVDPQNEHNRVRVMPGNANSPDPAMREPYIKVQSNGRYLDANGNEVLGDSPEAHIPVDTPMRSPFE